MKLNDISNCKHTVCFFEAPHRILDTLTELSEKFGQNDREVTCCRELTKLHEEIIGGMSLSQCLNILLNKSQGPINNKDDSSNSNRVRGEFTIVLGPKKIIKIDDSDRAKEYLMKLKLDGMSRSHAVKLTTELLKISKSEVYKIALEENW